PRRSPRDAAPRPRLAGARVVDPVVGRRRRGPRAACAPALGEARGRVGGGPLRALTPSARFPSRAALASLRGVRVLVIEDDEEAARYVVKGLAESGHVVDHAADGTRGLELALSGPYDVLVVDRMLPKLDGVAIVAALRRSGIATPVLVLSALARVE